MAVTDRYDKSCLEFYVHAIHVYTTRYTYVHATRMHTPHIYTRHTYVHASRMHTPHICTRHTYVHATHMHTPHICTRHTYAHATRMHMPHIHMYTPYPCTPYIHSGHTDAYTYIHMVLTSPKYDQILEEASQRAFHRDSKQSLAASAPAHHRCGLHFQTRPTIVCSCSSLQAAPQNRVWLCAALQLHI